MLSLDTQDARKADNRSSTITESGAYEGIITRAEKLQSEKGTVGLGISFKSDDGATANYLDLYTHNAQGEKLPSKAIVDAILCCTRTKEASEGMIDVEKWDKEAKSNYKAKVTGYPQLINKRIGLLLQQELQTDIKTGADVERVSIYGVFESGTNFTASEILDKATKPEKLARMIDAVNKKPVIDRRVKKTNQQAGNHSNTGSFDNFPDDDLDF